MTGAAIPDRFTRRWRQLRRIVHAEGWRGAGDRARKSLAERIVPTVPACPVRPSDVVAADLGNRFDPPLLRVGTGQPICINWVTVPAGPGAGGHTTLYRIVNHLQSLGYRNRVYFYDVNYVDLNHYASILRRHYGFEGEVSSVDDGMQDAHAVVATSWPTAYPVFNARCAGRRFFFVQDYEPDFYPSGASKVLAENTYRMGFHAITAGGWLAQRLRDEFGMDADHFDFGCDVDAYHLKEGPRSGVAYYARPEVARRGFELGIMALDIFARSCPQVEIHLYGDRIERLPFRFVNHGRVTPSELNTIYNRCYAGLSLSLTNVSLVPHEMLAAGCIPVVNDAPQNRIVLNNPFVRYASLTPHGLAAELEAVVSMEDFPTYSHEAAEGIRSASWQGAGATVDSIFKRSLAS